MVSPEVTDCASGEIASAEQSPERKRRELGSPSHAFTIQEFCDAHRLSRSQFYELEKRRLAPVVTDLGGKFVIMSEAAAAWRRRRIAAGSRKKRPATGRGKRRTVSANTTHKQVE